MSLYHKHRPTTFKGLLGQPDAVRMLLGFAKRESGYPQAILLTGPSGCGKTTIARILQTKLECSDSDYVEQNCADFRGIDNVREIRNRLHLSPIGGKRRIWYLDECHKMTNDAQNSMLKMLEDTPSHVNFVLATTDPVKLIKTIVTRCTVITVVPLNYEAMSALLDTVCKKENITLDDDVKERLIDVAEGSARKALVILDQIMGIGSIEEQLNAIASSDSRRMAIEIARTLANPRVTWAEMAKVIKGVEEDAESLRRMVLGYATTVMLGGGKNAARYNLIINAFRDHWFDCGRAGLVSACYEVVTAKT